MVVGAGAWLYRPPPVAGPKDKLVFPSAHRAALLCALAGLLACVPARGQDQGAPAGGPATAPPPAPTVEDAERADRDPNEGRLVKEVRFEGLKRVTETLARNQLRSATGRPYSRRTAQEDLRRLERLGEFRDIRVEVQIDQADLNVVLLFRVVESPLVQDVSVTGNREVSDQDIRETVGSVISLIAGVPVDDFQIGRAQRAIEELYRNRGYYQAQVTVDESELVSLGNIIFKVREGERVKVTVVRFEGNEAIPDKVLRRDLKTRTAGIFDRGVIDDTVLDGDVAAIVKAYLDKGFLDVRSSRQITPSPNGKEAIISFLIEEGLQYTLREVSVEVESGRRADAEAPKPPAVYSREQLAGLVKLKSGDAFSQKLLDDSVTAVRDAYLKLGYVDAQVRSVTLRDPERPFVDMRLVVTEGNRFRTGMVYIQGNDLTQQKVVRREVTVKPDRWLDGTAAADTERRLRNSQLFNTNPAAGPTPKVTIQPEDPATPGVRDVLIEVEETNTGSLGFGVAVGSDAGLTGAITLNQRNFDLADIPDSFDEFVRGRAFRGAGQEFRLAIQPGTEESNYSLSVTEPAFLESDYSLGGSGYFRQREYDEYDEQRVGTRWRIGRRFGERWTGNLAARIEGVTVDDIGSNPLTDLKEVEGYNLVTGFGPELVRTSVDNRFRPTLGTYSALSLERVGAFGGDYEFTKIGAEHQVYFPLDEDVLGYKTVLSFKGRVNYIPEEGEAPIFERYFLGGRSFRGFKFRGIGPTGVRVNGDEDDEKVGGNWAFFLGTEIEKPLYRDILAGVVFVDSGTVSEDVSFEKYRVAVGCGIRLYIPQLGQAPLAFDFGFPLQSEDRDNERIFSFSLDIPLQ